jgi:hypothetical protein
MTWASAARDDFFAAIDPYLIWADVTEFKDLDLKRPHAEAWFPVALELTEPATTFAQRCRDARWDWIRIPSVYRCAPKWLEQTTFCTATVRLQAFGNLNGELRRYVRRFQLGCPVFSEAKVESDEQATDFDAEDHPCLECASDTTSRSRLPTIVGVIDEGLAFAHERFRESVRGQPATRVEYFWNQNEDSKHGSIVRGLGYGAELSRREISRMFAEATHGNQIDEDAVYRAACHRTVARRTLHGTHVMDLACGEAPGKVNAASPRIIGVELPTQTVRDTSGLSLAVHALDGIRFILDRAARFSRAIRGHGNQALCPVVVNLSFGNIAGPHDGSSILEAGIDELIGLGTAGACPLQIVVPAGNNHLSRCHARIELAPGCEETLDWRILPDDATPSFLEIWIGAGSDGNAVAIDVMPPGGPGSGWVRNNLIVAGRLGGEAICTVVRLDRVATGKGRMILIAVAPTASILPKRGVAPAGTWRIRIRNEGRARKAANFRPGNVILNAWIQRDDKPLGFPRRGRQSRFDDARYTRFDPEGRPAQADGARSLIARAGTLNAIGTGNSTVVIGGYRKSDGAPAAYSASGPTVSEDRLGPDAMAISDRSIVLHGVLGAGARSGARVAMNGTSVAAPQVARWIAAQMSEGHFPHRESVIELARQSDPDGVPRGKRDPAPKPPPERGGGGRLGLPYFSDE